MFHLSTSELVQDFHGEVGLYNLELKTLGKKVYIKKEA